MDEHIVRYLEEACCHIRDKQEREQVREELLSHIEEAAIELTDNGVPREEAYRRVVHNMGAAEETGCKLGEVHSRFPAQDFRQAMTRLCWGLGLCFFQIDIGVFAYITDFLGAGLVLSALVCMVKCNKPLKIACILYFINFCFSNILITAAAILPPTELPTDFSTIRGLLSLGIQFLFMCFLIQGLSRLTQGEMAYRVKLCILQYIGVLLLAFLCMVNKLPAIIGVVIAGILYLYILVKLYRLRTYLWEHEEACNIGKMSGPAGWALSTVLIFVLIFPALLSITVAFIPPVHHKTDAPNGIMTGKIQEAMLSCGFPENVLANLPEEEIRQYEGIQNVNTVRRELNNARLDVTFVAAYFQEKNCRLLVMVQSREALKLPRTERMGIMFSEVNNHSNRELNKSMWQYFYKEDTAYQAEPSWHGYSSDDIQSGLDTFALWNNLLINNKIEYVEFKLMPNSTKQYFYYAVNTAYTENAVMYIDFYHQTGLLRIPFAIPDTTWSFAQWNKDSTLFEISP